MMRLLHNWLYRRRQRRDLDARILSVERSMRHLMEMQLKSSERHRETEDAQFKQRLRLRKIERRYL